MVLYHSLKINKRRGPKKLQGGEGVGKYRKINKRHPPPPPIFIRHLRVQNKKMIEAEVSICFPILHYLFL